MGAPAMLARNSLFLWTFALSQYLVHGENDNVEVDDSDHDATEAREEFMRLSASLYRDVPFNWLKNIETPTPSEGALASKVEYMVVNDMITDSHIVSNLLHSLLYHASVPWQKIHVRDETLLNEHDFGTSSILEWLQGLRLQPGTKAVAILSSYSRLNPTALESLVTSQLLDAQAPVVLGAAPAESAATSKSMQVLVDRYPGIFMNVAAFHRLASQKLPQRGDGTSLEWNDFMLGLVRSGANLRLVSEVCRTEPEEEEHRCASWGVRERTVPLISPELLDRYLKLNYEIEAGLWDEAEGRSRMPITNPNEVTIAVMLEDGKEAEQSKVISETWKYTSTVVPPNGYDMGDSVEIPIALWGSQVEGDSGIKKGWDKSASSCERMHTILNDWWVNRNNRSFFVLGEGDTLINVRDILEAITQTRQIPAPAMFHMYEKYRLPSRQRDAKFVNLARSMHPKYSKLNNTIYGAAARVTPLYMGAREWIKDPTSESSVTYIAGSGGIVMDWGAVERIMQCPDCRCDGKIERYDLILAHWMRRSQVPAVHHAGFHARAPDTYWSKELDMVPGVTFFTPSTTIEERTDLLKKRLDDSDDNLFDDWGEDDWNRQDLTEQEYNAIDPLWAPNTWLGRGYEISEVAEAEGYGAPEEKSEGDDESDNPEENDPDYYNLLDDEFKKVAEKAEKQPTTPPESPVEDEMSAQEMLEQLASWAERLDDNHKAGSAADKDLDHASPAAAKIDIPTGESPLVRQGVDSSGVPVTDEL